MSFRNHDEIFIKAFGDNVKNLNIELPALDVNHVIHTNYAVDPPNFVLTKTQLWDMECRKAAAPDIFIPTVVKAGTVEKFPSSFGTDAEYFTRIGNQITWKDPWTAVMVIEHVKVDHKNQAVTFVGAEEWTAPDGRFFCAGKGQPLFHVEHGVIGDDENRPLNTWHVTHLNIDGNDPEMGECFKAMGERKYLPEYVEIYIRDVLGVSLVRK